MSEGGAQKDDDDKDFGIEAQDSGVLGSVSARSILTDPNSPANRDRKDKDGNPILKRATSIVAGEKRRHSISFRDEKTAEGITDVKEVAQYKQISYEQPEINGSHEVTCYCTVQ